MTPASGQTPLFKFPFPTGTDAPNAADHLQELAEDVDDRFPWYGEAQVRPDPADIGGYEWLPVPGSKAGPWKKLHPDNGPSNNYAHGLWNSMAVTVGSNYGERLIVPRDGTYLVTLSWGYHPLVPTGARPTIITGRAGVGWTGHDGPAHFRAHPSYRNPSYEGHLVGKNWVGNPGEMHSFPLRVVASSGLWSRMVDTATMNLTKDAMIACGFTVFQNPGVSVGHKEGSIGGTITLRVVQI